MRTLKILSFDFRLNLDGEDGHLEKKSGNIFLDNLFLNQLSCGRASESFYFLRYGHFRENFLNRRARHFWLKSGFFDLERPKYNPHGQK